MDELISLLANDKTLFLGLIAIISLMVGSFLNVVRTRLPAMLDVTWRAECHNFLELPNPASKLPYFNLFQPRSHCPSCKQMISWKNNIPLLSFVILRGKCHNCKQAISWHYPLVELVTLILSVAVAYRFGFSWQTALGLIITWVLIAQTWIDLEHYFLPDEITFSCLWLGLLASCIPIFPEPQAAIIGAASGYLSLWMIYWLFKLATKKDGMGYGDFKLLAMLGACLGWQQLPMIILVSSLAGTLVGLSLIALKKKDYSAKLPFGPYLAAAGWLAMLYGSEINHWYLASSGIQL